MSRQSQMARTKRHKILAAENAKKRQTNPTKKRKLSTASTSTAEKSAKNMVVASATPVTPKKSVVSDNVSENESSSNFDTSERISNKDSNNNTSKLTNIVEEPRKRRLASLNAEFLVHYCSNKSTNTNSIATTAANNNTSNHSNHQEKQSPKTQPSPTKKTPVRVAKKNVKKSASPAATKKKKKPTKRNAKSIDDDDEDDDDNDDEEEEGDDDDANNTEELVKNEDTIDMKDVDNDEETKSPDLLRNKVEGEKSAIPESKKAKPNVATKKKRMVRGETAPVSTEVSLRPKREASMRASAMIIQTNEIEKTRFQYLPNQLSAIAHAVTSTSSASKVAKTTELKRSNSKKKQNGDLEIDENVDTHHHMQSNHLVAESAAAAAAAAAAAISVFQIPAVPAYLTAGSPNKKLLLKQSMSDTNLFSMIDYDHQGSKKEPTPTSTNELKKYLKYHKSPQYKTHLKDAGGVETLNDNGEEINNLIHHINSQTSLSTSRKSVPTTLRQVSTTTTLGANSTSNYRGKNGADESSNSDILIVLEKEGIKKETTNGHGSTNKRHLSEEALADHNRLNGTSYSSCGAYNNFNRDFVSKWISEHTVSDEKPFEPIVIPIETYGTKILNEPQYLLKKANAKNSALSTATTSTMTATTTATKTNGTYKQPSQISISAQPSLKLAAATTGHVSSSSPPPTLPSSSLVVNDKFNGATNGTSKNLPTKNVPLDNCQQQRIPTSSAFKNGNGNSNGNENCANMASNGNHNEIDNKHNQDDQDDLISKKKLKNGTQSKHEDSSPAITNDYVHDNKDDLSANHAAAKTLPTPVK